VISKKMALQLRVTMLCNTEVVCWLYLECSLCITYFNVAFLVPQKHC